MSAPTMGTAREAAEGRISREVLRGWARRLNVPGGGFSVSATSGADVRSGFALSVHPEREQRIGDTVTADDLMAYVRANADLLMRPGAVLGGWRDAESGQAFLDVSTVVHDRERALSLARAHDQLAFYDLSTGREVRV